MYTTSVVKFVLLTLVTLRPLPPKVDLDGQTE